MKLVYTRSGIFFPNDDSQSDPSRIALTRTGFEAYATPFRNAKKSGHVAKSVDPMQCAEMLFGIQATTTRLWLMDYWPRRERLDTRLLRAFDVLVRGLQ